MRHDRSRPLPRANTPAGVTRLPADAIVPVLLSGHMHKLPPDSLNVLQKFARTFQNFSIFFGFSRHVMRYYGLLSIY
jgi:hypothetical protein